jgi:large subunit ribosomal protein L5
MATRKTEKQTAPRATRRKSPTPPEAPAVEAVPAAEPSEEPYFPRLLKRYQQEVVPYLMQRFGYTNVMQVPRIQCVAINMGIGDAARDDKLQQEAVYTLSAITGQRPVLRRARRSIAGFKVRRGMVVGCSVTLRRWRMWEFLDRLLHVALPRVRDFRGISPHGFDGRGNYTLGIREQLVFPEVDYAKISKIRGMNITIVTTARTDAEAYELLRALGFPFRES